MAIKDRDGNELKVGDRVLVECTIVDLRENGGMRGNYMLGPVLELQVAGDDAPGDSPRFPVEAKSTARVRPHPHRPK
jgi:hypothetical protein